MYIDTKRRKRRYAHLSRLPLSVTHNELLNFRILQVVMRRYENVKHAGGIPPYYSFQRPLATTNPSILTPYLERFFTTSPQIVELHTQVSQSVFAVRFSHFNPLFPDTTQRSPSCNPHTLLNNIAPLTRGEDIYRSLLIEHCTTYQF